MELPPEIKRKTLEDTITQFEVIRYQSETMGRVWKTIGSEPDMKSCAEKAGMAARAIDELNKELQQL